MIEETIREIRKQCRLKMNGVASTSMREKGLNYKLNFGLMIPQIKALASEYKQNKNLAETLWLEDTRELKILATLLYPISDFSKDTALQWASSIPNQEIREHLCLNLLQEIPFAKELAIELSSSNDTDIRTTGYWLMVRLFLSKKVDSTQNTDNFPQIWEDAISENRFVRNAALSTLKHLGRQSEEIARDILKRIECYQTDSSLIKQEMYNNLSFEFDLNQE